LAIAVVVIGVVGALRLVLRDARPLIRQAGAEGTDKLVLVMCESWSLVEDAVWSREADEAEEGALLNRWSQVRRQRKLDAR
jgi:hypothetical protein